MGFYAFHKTDFPPSQIRLCVAGFMTRFVWGTSSGEEDAAGVRGDSDDGFGVFGHSTNQDGVVGTSGGAGAGVRGQAEDLINGRAAFFNGDVLVREGNLEVLRVDSVGGNVRVSGEVAAQKLTAFGDKPFKIDHPLDPQNKYLLHNAVESSERKNVYDGEEQLEANGEASVKLPDWFEALNGDFRYQLTAVGGPAPNLHVAEEISENSGNRFKIAGGEEGMKVCWQVTGTRKDPWAAANPFEVEQEKPEEERGRYLYLPEGVAEEQRPPEPSGIDLARLEEGHRRQMEELRRRMEELRRRAGPQEEAPPEST